MGRRRGSCRGTPPPAPAVHAPCCKTRLTTPIAARPRAASCLVPPSPPQQRDFSPPLRRHLGGAAARRCRRRWSMARSCAVSWAADLADMQLSTKLTTNVGRGLVTIGTAGRADAAPVAQYQIPLRASVVGSENLTSTARDQTTARRARSSSSDREGRSRVRTLNRVSWERRALQRRLRSGGSRGAATRRESSRPRGPETRQVEAWYHRPRPIAPPAARWMSSAPVAWALGVWTTAKPASSVEVSRGVRHGRAFSVRPLARIDALDLVEQFPSRRSQVEMWAGAFSCSASRSARTVAFFGRAFGAAPQSRGAARAATPAQASARTTQRPSPRSRRRSPRGRAARPGGRSPGSSGAPRLARERRVGLNFRNVSASHLSGCAVGSRRKAF